MGMYYIGLSFSLFIVLLCVIATISMIIEEDKPDPIITIPLGFGIVFAVISVFLMIDYDNTVAIKADEFFLTRKDTYSCEKELYSCKLQIQEWQADSVYWKEKLDNIFSEVKVPLKNCVPDSGNFWKEVKENTKQ